MHEILLIFHIIFAVLLVGAVLLQKSEGGALGIGGGGGGLMTTRGSANLLTRATAGFATAFIITSLTLAIMANRSNPDRSILDAPAGSTPAAPTAPAQPAQPAVPLAK